MAATMTATNPETMIADPRPFATVLADWLDRRGLTAYAAAPLLGATKGSVRNWVRGAPCPAERAYRALMTLIERGEA